MIESKTGLELFLAMFSHYSSFIPLVLVLFVWGTFVALCVTVINIFRRKYKSLSFLQLCLIMLNQNTHIYIESWSNTSSQLSITICLYFGQRQGQIMQ